MPIAHVAINTGRNARDWDVGHVVGVGWGGRGGRKVAQWTTSDYHFPFNCISTEQFQQLHVRCATGRYISAFISISYNRVETLG